jgi:hypothetical protein
MKLPSFDTDAVDCGSLLPLHDLQLPYCFAASSAEVRIKFGSPGSCLGCRRTLRGKVVPASKLHLTLNRRHRRHPCLLFCSKLSSLELKALYWCAVSRRITAARQ